MAITIYAVVAASTIIVGVAIVIVIVVMNIDVVLSI
jgi:hypothetical protein